MPFRKKVSFTTQRTSAITLTEWVRARFRKGVTKQGRAGQAVMCLLVVLDSIAIKGQVGATASATTVTESGLTVQQSQSQASHCLYWSPIPSQCQALQFLYWKPVHFMTIHNTCNGQLQVAPWRAWIYAVSMTVRYWSLHARRRCVLLQSIVCIRFCEHHCRRC